MTGYVRALKSRAMARNGAARDETGAVLVLALVFLIAVGGIVGALANWATNDLNNTAKFTSARSLQYAATSVTQTAIQSMRYAPLLSTAQGLQTLNASPPSYCWGTGGNSSLTTVEGTTSENMTVWCSTVWTPTSGNTRVVTFSTCLSTYFQGRLYLPVYSLFQMGMLLSISLAANALLERLGAWRTRARSVVVSLAP